MHCNRQRRSPFYNADTAGALSHVDRSPKIFKHECVQTQVCSAFACNLRASHCSGHAHQLRRPQPKPLPAAKSSVAALIHPHPTPMHHTNLPSPEGPLITSAPGHRTLPHRPLKRHPRRRQSTPMRARQNMLTGGTGCFGNIPLELRAHRLGCARK